MTHRTVVASDLDRTLIYSPASLGLTMPDERAPRLLCVEVYQHKPLSFMTERAAGLLCRLADASIFVPTTTRTREQYQRVSLPGPVPAYAICANGGHLLVDGRTDQDWHHTVRRRVADGCAPLTEVRVHLAAVSEPAWVYKDRVAEDLFAYLVVERSLIPDGWVGELTEWCREHGWTVSLQGRKVYAVPEPLTKSAALAEVVRRTGAQRVLAAGDSVLDTDLLLAADAAWRPGHGELHDLGWSAPGVTAVGSSGVAAGQDIVSALLARVEPGIHPVGHPEPAPMP